MSSMGISIREHPYTHVNTGTTLLLAINALFKTIHISLCQELPDTLVVKIPLMFEWILSCLSIVSLLAMYYY